MAALIFEGCEQAEMSAELVRGGVAMMAARSGGSRHPADDRMPRLGTLAISALCGDDEPSGARGIGVSRTRQGG